MRRTRLKCLVFRRIRHQLRQWQGRARRFMGGWRRRRRESHGPLRVVQKLRANRRCEHAFLNQNINTIARPSASWFSRKCLTADRRLNLSTFAANEGHQEHILNRAVIAARLFRPDEPRPSLRWNVSLVDQLAQLDVFLPSARCWVRQESARLDPRANTTRDEP